MTISNLKIFRYGHFSGINRKVQLKYQPYGNPKKSSSEEGGYYHQYLTVTNGSQIVMMKKLSKFWGKDIQLLKGK